MPSRGIRTHDAPSTEAPAKRAPQTGMHPSSEQPMTLDQAITHAAARAAIAWSNMDEQQAREWQTEVDPLLDQRDGLTPAEHAHIHSAAFTEIMCQTLKGSPDHSTVRHG